MLIQTVIDHIKEYHKGVFEGKQIDERQQGIRFCMETLIRNVQASSPPAGQVWMS